MLENKPKLNYRDLTVPAVFAHRGSSAYAPENTLAAFKLAVEQGADGIELDVKLSADGQVVVLHDDTVDRTTDGTGWVHSLTLPELKKLDAGSKFSPGFKTERLPTLVEVFEAVGGETFIHVELKNFLSPMDDLPDRVSALVKQFNLEKSVILSSFNPIALIRARFLLPGIAMGLLTTAGLANIALRSGVVRFGPQLALHAAMDDVTPGLIDAARQRKCRVNVYTLKQADQMRRLFEMGVDGIFTPDPVLAQKVLSQLS